MICGRSLAGSGRVFDFVLILILSFWVLILDFDFDFGFGFDFGVEPGNGARGKGAAFEPPCLAQRLRSLPPVRFQAAGVRRRFFLTRSCAIVQRACAWPVACAVRLPYRS